MNFKSKISILSSILFALSNIEAQAGTMGPVEVIAPGQAYIGVFGGGGASNHVRMSQYATAFFFEAEGGPLAVDSFGRTNSRSFGFIGWQIGYEWPARFLNAMRAPLSFSPAVELEGYYLGRSSFVGHDLNNDTDRLPEHDFVVTYPIRTGVFLGNALINFNPANFNRWHPYVGVGIGGAVLSISNATSVQVSPPELNVNHYNANPNDKVSTFASQVKAGLNFDLTEHLNIFAEYRWLYLANTRFVFGSTVYATHAATSSWMANFGSQHYNMGDVGIRFSV